MVYIYLGSDEFSKKAAAGKLRSEQKAEFIDVHEPEISLISQAVNSRSLFEGNKIVRVFEALEKIDLQALAENLLNPQNGIIFFQTTLDKRTSQVKSFLANSKFKTEQFDLPKGLEFSAWIKNRAKELDLRLSAKGLSLLLERLGANKESYGQPGYDLLQVDSELKKLKTFVGSKEIQVEDITQLVSEVIEEDIFKITTAIADRDKRTAVKYLVDYFDRMPGSDEKSKIIALSGIISEQFRGIFLFQNFIEQGQSETNMAKASGFSSGKTFIYKKLAQRFSKKKIFETLKKLELLDEETKTSNNPAELQFFMIMNSVMSKE